MREVVAVAGNAVETTYVVMDEPGLGNERYHRVRHAARAAGTVSVPHSVQVPEVMRVAPVESDQVLGSLALHELTRTEQLV